MGSGRIYPLWRNFIWVIPVFLLIIMILYLDGKIDVNTFDVLSHRKQFIDLEVLKTNVTSEYNYFKDHSTSFKKMKTYREVKVLPDKERLRILVTGGAGFIGSHLVDRLMLEGHEVTVCDNFFTGKASNLLEWEGHFNYNLITHDIVDPILLEVDQIYHLACPASPSHYQYNPIKTIKTNTKGTLNMLGLAKRVSAKILLASTSEIYGNPLTSPQVESYFGHVNPIGSRACYEEGKRVAETMMYSYAQQGKTEVRVARIFNTFGPKMYLDDGRVVSNFIRQALQNKPLTVYGNGEARRSFQYIDDLIDGLIALMNNSYSDPVNIGNPTDISVVDFAKLIIKMTNSNSSIIFSTVPVDTPINMKPDVTIANEKLGWYTKVKIEDGLSKTISYFKQELKIH
jgi:UDP-glucuronate decarboxylase